MPLFSENPDVDGSRNQKMSHAGRWPMFASHKATFVDTDWLVVLEDFLFSIIYRIILPIDFHIFQDG